MNIAVVGSRDFMSLSLVRKLPPQLGLNDVVITGGANAVDVTIEQECRKLNIPVRIFRPQYQNFPAGQKHLAPLARNKEIVLRSDAMVAFWNGKSRGTKHAINLAIEKGITVIVIDEKGESRVVAHTLL